MISNSAIIKASETSLNSLRQEYQLGSKTITDLIDEEGNLLNARVDYLNSKKDYILNYFKIRSLEGSLTEIFKDYLPSVN